MVRFSIGVQVLVLIGAVLEMVHALAIVDVIRSEVNFDRVFANLEETLAWQLDFVSLKYVGVFLGRNLLPVDDKTADFRTLEIDEDIRIDLL